MEQARTDPYASAATRGSFAVAAIVLVGALDALLAHAYGLDLRAFQAHPEAAHLAELTLPSLEPRFVVVDALRFSALLVAAALFLAWIHRAYRNLAPLGATGLRYTPGVAAGSLLIPIANFVVPFLVMCELRAKSAAPTGSGSGRFALPALWWLAFVVSCVARTYLVELIGAVDPPVGRFRVATELALVAQGASVVAAVCVVMLIREVDRNQRARAETLPPPAAEGALAAHAGSWPGRLAWCGGAAVVALAIALGADAIGEERRGAGLGGSVRPGERIDEEWRARLEGAGVPAAAEELLWLDHVRVPRVDGTLAFALTDRRVVVLRLARERAAASPESLALDEIRRVHIAWTERLGDRTIVELGRDPAEEPGELRLFLSPELGGDHAFLDALGARLPTDAVRSTNVPDL